MQDGVNSRWVIHLAFMLAAICSSQEITTASTQTQDQIDLKRVLTWLPADTETLLVANGPFRVSNFGGQQHEYKNHELTTEELEEYFEGLTLSLFGSGKGILEKHLRGTRVLFALEGSRHFRPPADLGELPFEGATLAVFEEDLDDRRDAFMKEAAHVAVRIEQIEGQKVAVFEEQWEKDVWTIFITFPKQDVVIVATNERFLQETLARMQGAKGERAFPESSREWKYLNGQTQFWGIRHYDKLQAKSDPTSPFGGRKSANFPDEEAVGMTYQCDPKTERRATLTYLAGPRGQTRKIAEERFPDAGEVEQKAQLHIQYRELEPGVIQSIFDLTHSQAADLFFFVFMMHLGHGIYV